MLSQVIRSRKALVALGTRVGPLPRVLPLVSAELVHAGESPWASFLTAFIGLLPCKRDKERLLSQGHGGQRCGK